MIKRRDLRSNCQEKKQRHYNVAEDRNEETKNKTNK
jgi:hypothetical protein